MRFDDRGNEGLSSSRFDNEVSEHDARQELDRILSDPEFHCAERNRRFLRFVCEELFCGRENSVKAYTIAVDVFGRASSFDPSTDPIVRIEATRLRAALVRYYELHGQGHPVRIDLPKGRYVPVFSRLAGVSRPPTGGIHLPSGPSPRLPDQLAPMSRLNPTPRAKWLAVSVGIAVGLLSGAFFMLRSPGDGAAPVFSRKPNLAIELRLAGDKSDGDAMALRDAVVVALSNFQTLRIDARETTASTVGARAGTRGVASSVQGRYRLQLKYSARPTEPALWWQVVDEATGEALRSGNEKAAGAGGFAEDHSVERLAARLAVRLASSRGVINTLETARELDSPTLGNGCVLRGILATESRDKAALAQARSCLETTLRLHENDADAHAMLAAVLLKIDTPDAPTELTDRAVASAARAVVLAPDSDRSHFAQMLAQFRIGHVEVAVLAGRHALELNPNNAMISARLANILFVTGRWDEGVELAQAAQSQGPFSQDAEATLAFAAYRRGHFDEALGRLERMSGRDCYCMQLLKVATLGQLGRRDEAEAAIADLRRSRPQFENSVHADLARRTFAPDLIALLQAGLEKAGLRVA